MANTVPKFRKLPANNDSLTSIAGTTGTPDNTYTFIIGTATVTAATGGAIAAQAMGLTSMKGSIVGRAVVSDNALDTVTTPNVTGSYCWMAWGPDATKRVNS